MLTENNDITHANCWAEINLANLKHNVSALGSFGVPIMAVMKADAYGHSTDVIAPTLNSLGIKNFGVATAVEGASLRNLVGNDATIYVMTASVPADALLIVQHRLTSFVCAVSAIKSLSNAARQLKTEAFVHIEIDTGIGRAGVSTNAFLSLLNYAIESAQINVSGICTHFTSGEDKTDAQAQYEIFQECLNEVNPALLQSLTIHAANSPGILNVPGARYSLIRPGLLLYGIAPSPGDTPELSNGLRLKPVLTLQARVILVRKLPAGTPISYGRTYVLPQPATIATVGIGYGDGYSRRFSNVGTVILPSGELAPIRGRVCMDQLCVEVPDSAVEEGDVVTLVGSAEANKLRAADMADMIGATAHEITTCLTRRVPRIAI